MNDFYVYVYLDPRKPGNYSYGDYMFEFEPFYVGKGRGNRYTQHIHQNRLNNEKNYNKKTILESLLSTNLVPKILKVNENLNEKQSFELETFLISLIGRLTEGGPLTNVTLGGDGFSSEDTKKTWLDLDIRKKRVNSLKLWWSGFTPEERSMMKVGNKNPMFGKIHSENFKKRRSEQYSGDGNPMFGRTGDKSPHYGKKHSEETRKKIGEAKKGHKHSEETKKKISQTLKKLSSTSKGNKNFTKQEIKTIREKWVSLIVSNTKISAKKILANDYCVSVSCIDNIVYHRTYRY